MRISERSGERQVWGRSTNRPVTLGKPLAIVAAMLTAGLALGLGLALMSGNLLKSQPVASALDLLNLQGAQHGSMTLQSSLSIPQTIDISPPSDLALLPLNSSIHVTWTPSTDPNTAWHVVSAWDGGTLIGTKVVGKTSRAAQPNNLVPNHTYTIKVQAMDAQGNLSTAISGTVATDMQSPMTNAAFFENFNEPAGNLDPNFFDVRTSHGAGLQPDSIGTDKMLVFGSENHFHTQIIGGIQRAELYIRPRIPFDFTDRTGTFQTEVDTAPVQHSNGKWFEFHLVRNLPWSSEEFGAGDGQDFPDSVEFSVRQADDDQGIVNTAQITVNIGGNVTVFTGTTNILTPVNVRMPMVLRVSRTTAEMLINGVSVAYASGFSLPFTQGYWVIAQRGWYASRDLRTVPVILQLIHWDTVQYDGPQGSYNSIAKTYIQPGCQGEVHNEHDGIVGCSKISFSPGSDTHTVTLNIPDNVGQARSAQLLYNGSANSPFNVSINGHNITIPTKACCFLDALNTADFSPTWLTTGDNQLQFTYTGNDGTDLSQVEVEVVYNQQRVMTIPPQMNMPMLSLTAQSFRVDHLINDPLVYTGTTYLYSLGWGAPVPFTATVISTETPWLTVSPGSGTLNQPRSEGASRRSISKSTLPVSLMTATGRWV